MGNVDQKLNFLYELVKTFWIKVIPSR